MFIIKSNSIVGSIQVEANLLEKLSDYLHIRKTKILLHLIVLKVISHVALALTVSEILKFQIFTLIVGQGH